MTLNFRFHIELLNDRSENEVDKKYVSRCKPLVFKQLQDPTFKSFAVHNELAFYMYNYNKKPGDRLYFHQLEKKIVSYNVYIAFHLGPDLLFPTFDWKIKRLVESGFFVHWIDRYLSHPSVQAPKPEPDDDKIVLTMDHLMVGFTIWLGMLLIASVVFIAEFARVHLINYLQGILFQMVLRKLQRLQRNH